FEALRKEADRLGKKRATNSEQDEESSEPAAEPARGTTHSANKRAEFVGGLQPVDVRERSFVTAGPSQGAMAREDTPLPSQMADFHSQFEQQVPLDIPVQFSAPVADSLIADSTTHNP